MCKTAFLSGATGQDGSLLSRFLLDKDYKVVGMVRRTSCSNFWRLEELGVLSHKNFVMVSGDLTDQGSLDRIVAEHQPSEVYNLGAQSFVGSSWSNWESTSDIVGHGAVRVFEAVRKFAPKAKVYQASSSEMFGGANRIEVLNEFSKFDPRSPYGAAKVYAHNMAQVYKSSYNLFIACGILFNHESEYRGEEFVTRKISKGVANILLGKQDIITLGNLDACRDWGFAGDFIEAMWLMLQQPFPDDFIIATGIQHSVREFVQQSLYSAGVVPDGFCGVKRQYVMVDPDFIRPADVGYLLGDASKAKRILGWSPKTSFEQLVFKMVQKDIERLK